MDRGMGITGHTGSTAAQRTGADIVTGTERKSEQRPCGALSGIICSYHVCDMSPTERRLQL